MANPLVRKDLKFYPEDSSPHLSEARQGDKWLHEVEAKFSGIMARGLDGQDYFADEPAMANMDQFGTPGAVLPVRFFEQKNQRMARVYRLGLDTQKTGFRVEAKDCFDIPLHALFLSYPCFAESYQ